MNDRIKLGLVAVYLVGALAGRLHATTVNLPDITITSFGHGYSPALDTNQFGGIADGVSLSGGFGTYSTTPFVGQFQNGDVVRQHFIAPAGYQFSFFSDPQLPNEVFGTQIDWRTGAPDSIGTYQPLGVTYDNPHGPTPAPIYGSAGVSDSGQLLSWDFHSPVLGNFLFTGITVEFTVSNSPLAGTHTFTISSEAEPSFYANGFGFRPSDATLLSLVPLPIPEPASLLVLVSTLGLAMRRRGGTSG